eukprot:2239279-Rhodomonas_salina.1
MSVCLSAYVCVCLYASVSVGVPRNCPPLPSKASSSSPSLSLLPPFLLPFLPFFPERGGGRAGVRRWRWERGRGRGRG